LRLVIVAVNPHESSDGADARTGFSVRRCASNRQKQDGQSFKHARILWKCGLQVNERGQRRVNTDDFYALPPLHDSRGNPA
jgi:hypothetical protein